MGERWEKDERGGGGSGKRRHKERERVREKERASEPSCVRLKQRAIIKPRPRRGKKVSGGEKVARRNEE